MKKRTIRMRSGTHQGSRHRQLGINNQDARLAECFGIPAFSKTYHVGLVSDGCTGYPAFSRTEVGSNLLVLMAYQRIQAFLCSGMKLEDIPRMLFHSVTEFLRTLTNLMAPPNLHWPYPPALTQRKGLSPSERFRTDYLSATLLGFVTDGEDIVVFSAGDGIILMGSDRKVIDQNDRPDYPASSIDNPGRSFELQMAKLAEIRRLAIMTDGLKTLTADPAFTDRLFSHMPKNPMGVQYLLNVTFNARPEDMDDDTTAIVLDVIETEEEET